MLSTAPRRKKKAPRSAKEVPLSTFTTRTDLNLRLPDSREVWDYLRKNPPLSTASTVSPGFAFHREHPPADAETISNRRRPGWKRWYVHTDGDTPIYGRPKTAWVNPAKAVIRRPGAGPFGVRDQLLVNRTRDARGSWSMSAWLDPEGLAVKSDFLVARSTSASAPPVFLWALLNSPIANGYVLHRASKRHIIRGNLLSLPIPKLDSEGVNSVVSAAAAYVATVRDEGLFTFQSFIRESVRTALLRMDAAILRLYDLPPRLERQLLDLFAGVERKGVGCDFRGYYPTGLDAYVPSMS